MSDSDKIEKYNKAWEKFETKMASLRKRQHEILVSMVEKLDKQKIDKLRNKMKK
jgi:hypothetical protein